MGRKKSKVQRLPPSERTVVGSKVQTFAPPPRNPSSSLPPGVPRHPPTVLRLAEAASIAPPGPPSGALSSPPVSARGGRARVDLDDDSLRKVLRHAGPAGALTAARVCRRWRRVAREVLAETSRVELGLAWARLPPSQLTYRGVLRSAAQFPNVAHLSLRSFPRTDLLPAVAPFLMRRLRSGTLREADFSGLVFGPDDLPALLDGCPALSALALVRSPGVTRDALGALTDALRRRPRRTLDAVDVSHCPGVERDGLAALLAGGVVRAVRAAQCCNAREVRFFSPITATALSLHGCRNLLTLDVPAGALRELNLSQCVSLTTLRVLPEGERPLELVSLNLASCARLQAVDFGTRAADGQPAVPGSSLAKLEELLLSGARSLSAAALAKEFGLSSDACAMPGLRRLVAIDAQIELLSLREYSQLEHVDFSGCPVLNVVHIAECGKLCFLNLSSRRAPMARVDISVPASTRVQGRRKPWRWQSIGTTQTITYGL